MAFLEPIFLLIQPLVLDMVWCPALGGIFADCALRRLLALREGLNLLKPGLHCLLVPWSLPDLGRERRQLDPPRRFNCIQAHVPAPAGAKPRATGGALHAE